MKYKILVAEDEKSLGKALSLKLTHVGFDVTVVYDGEETLKAMGKEPYSLILLDLVMPKKDGFEVLEELQKQKNKTPVIVLSNLGQEEDLTKAKELGAKDYFIKSNTSLHEIIEHISDFLKK